jgi:hypothetical protein
MMRVAIAPGDRVEQRRPRVFPFPRLQPRKASGLREEVRAGHLTENATLSNGCTARGTGHEGQLFARQIFNFHSDRLEQRALARLCNCGGFLMSFLIKGDE